MIGLLLGLAAHAASVECNGLEAASLLAEARIEEGRAPVTHPELIPGLALVSAHTGPELRTALDDLCSPDGALSLTRGEAWADASWEAHTFLLTRTETVQCTLFQRTIAISVAVASGVAPRYTLRSRLPVTRAPIDDCASTPTWREERVLGGEGSPVRLVLATDVEDGTVVHSAVLARRATPAGWREQSLMSPAPDRLLSGGDGPEFHLTERFEDKWIVAHGDRTGLPDACEAVPGQTVWTWSDDAWVPHEGREAATLLLQRGLWRIAGQDGWLAILLQDDEEDADILAAQAERLQRRAAEPLYTVPSAGFPGLNPGFLIVVPGPWATREGAEEGKRATRSWRRSYVKQAWEAVDPCP